MRHQFILHVKYLTLGVALSFMPNTETFVNLRGIHLYFGIPLKIGNFSIISETSYSIDIPILFLIANISVVYLFFFGVSLFKQLISNNRPEKRLTQKSIQTNIIFVTIITTLAFIEIFCLHYLMFQVFSNTTLCVFLALLMAGFPLIFFFCTNIFLHWLVRLFLCLLIHAYLLFFLVFRIFNALHPWGTI